MQLICGRQESRPHNAILATIERAEEWSRGLVIGCCAPHGFYRRPTRYVNQRRGIAASRSGHIVRTFTAVFERCSDGGNVPAAGRYYRILVVTEFSQIRPPRLLCELPRPSLEELLTGHSARSARNW